MASIFGDDGGSVVGGRRRRPTNAGYEPEPPGPTGGGAPPGGSAPNPTTPVNLPSTPSSSSAPPTPNWGTLSSGFDQGKLNDPSKHSFKYDFARTVAPFDPKKGFTDDVLNALDSLGYADFYSPGGDKLGIRGVTQKGRDAGMDPRDFLGDFINAFDAQNDATRWGFDWFDDPFTNATTPGPTVPEAGPFDPRVFGGGGGSAPDMSWLADLLKTFAPAPAAAPTPAPTAPPVTVNVPGLQPSATYSQPSPTFGGGYVSPGFGQRGDSSVDATSLLSLALPELLKDPAAANSPLVRQILRLVQGGGA